MRWPSPPDSVTALALGSHGDEMMIPISRAFVGRRHAGEALGGFVQVCEGQGQSLIHGMKRGPPRLFFSARKRGRKCKAGYRN